MRPGQSYFLLHLLAASTFFLVTQSSDYPIATVSTVWTNNLSIDNTVSFSGRTTTIRAIVLRGSGSDGPAFACGFFCNGACHTYLFAIFIVYAYDASRIENSTDASRIENSTDASPQVVWSANRNHPVKENSTLHLSDEGNLILKDVDGTSVWSTNTSGRSVAGMELTDKGNLVLYDDRNETVWDSFNYPTDSWLISQSLREGQRLTPNVSATNWTSSGDLYLTTVPGGLAAYTVANPPAMYYSKFAPEFESEDKSSTYVTFGNSSLTIFYTSSGNSRQQNYTIQLPQASSMQYMRLESDGHLRLYQWAVTGTMGWTPVADVLGYGNAQGLQGDCGYPTVCGEYGFCSPGGGCSCLNPSYFRPVDDRQPKLGCALLTPLSCQSTRYHRLLRLDDVGYFSYNFNDAVSMRTDRESCRQACLRNCSCKAAFFKYITDSPIGDCFLPSKVSSMMNTNQTYGLYNSTAYIKVQDVQRASDPLPPPNGPQGLPEKSTSAGIIAGVSISALGVVTPTIVFVFLLMRRRNVQEYDDEDHIEENAGLTRFSFEVLKVATKNFCHKLGGGSFGSVFRGTLNDGVTIAVKRLDNIGQGKKEFLAEVKTIGNIHHKNLVKLIGYCSENSYRLLAYEYMLNGSLDKWIFCRNQDDALDWQTRFQIITNIAEGLSYLHEECTQRIAHLDIKPQNILLDQGFHARISDFGLAKLIDREQSHVLTAMRGTRGYLAPEWLTSKITEKADVFSFGVVVMEIVCGRRNLDHSQPDEYVHLVTLLKDKVRENRLWDIADRSSNMESYENEVIKMMRLAMWCLQTNSTRRPKMSTVLKALEGSVNVETNIEYDFAALPLQEQENAESLGTLARPSAWLLSGPR